MRTKLMSVLLLALVAIVACQSSQATAPASAPGSLSPAGSVLTLVAADGSTQTFSLADLQAMPATSGHAGFKSSTGTIGGLGQYKGVAVKDLVAKLPAFDQTMGLNITASDGYAITYGYDQVMSGSGFTQYDPGTGAELKSPLDVTMILAYEADGKPLDAKQDGNLRVMVVSDQPTQVVDGHWTTKFVVRIEAKALARNWSLHLEGRDHRRRRPRDVRERGRPQLPRQDLDRRPGPGLDRHPAVVAGGPRGRQHQARGPRLQ